MLLPSSGHIFNRGSDGSEPRCEKEWPKLSKDYIELQRSQIRQNIHTTGIYHLIEYLIVTACGCASLFFAIQIYVLKISILKNGVSAACPAG
jgi:hypothetical protein